MKFQMQLSDYMGYQKNNNYDYKYDIQKLLHLKINKI